MSYQLKLLVSRPPGLDRLSHSNVPYFYFSCSCGEEFAWDPAFGTRIQCPTCKTVLELEPDGAVVDAA